MSSFPGSRSSTPVTEPASSMNRHSRDCRRATVFHSAFGRMRDGSLRYRVRSAASSDDVSLGGAMTAAFRRGIGAGSVSYTHLRAHETRHDLVCRLLLETK